ncbi:MAG: FimD/PapC C-terminal domain-containing protein [Arenicellales bacterium]
MSAYSLSPVRSMLWQPGIHCFRTSTLTRLSHIEIGGVKETVLPYARSGLFVDFPVRRSRNALVLLRRADGSPMPAGARVTVSPGENEFLVGKRGEVYLMDLVDSNRLSVKWKGAPAT